MTAVVVERPNQVAYREVNAPAVGPDTCSSRAARPGCCPSGGEPGGILLSRWSCFRFFWGGRAASNSFTRRPAYRGGGDLRQRLPVLAAGWRQGHGDVEGCDGAALECAGKINPEMPALPQQRQGAIAEPDPHNLALAGWHVRGQRT